LASTSAAKLSPGDLENVYWKLVEDIEEIQRNPKRKRSGFLMRVPLLPAAVVQRAASALSFAFLPPVAVVMLCLILAATFYALSSGMLPEWSFESLCWVWPLFGISVCMHEFGHASACAYYGIPPKEIGFTIYLVWPAFYSDVSGAWQLRRLQRAVVDIGGVYFQLIIAGVYTILYAATGWEPLTVAILVTVGSVLFSLNPVFKWDGYWLMSDLLGVTNLAEQRWRILRHVTYKLRGKTAAPLPWSWAVLIFLALFTLASIVIWGLFLWVLFPVFMELLADYPSRLLDFAERIGNGAFLPTREDVRVLITSTFLGVVLVLSIIRAVRGTRRLLSKRQAP
jgi:putative peptide zinc metalloprotease protein